MKRSGGRAALAGGNIYTRVWSIIFWLAQRVTTASYLYFKWEGRAHSEGFRRVLQSPAEEV